MCGALRHRKLCRELASKLEDSPDDTPSDHSSTARITSVGSFPDSPSYPNSPPLFICLGSLMSHRIMSANDR